MTNEAFTALAMSFPGAEESPHFEKTSFRVKNVIYATLSLQKRVATLKFTPEQQDAFCAFPRAGFSPVANAWGAKGWTNLDLEKATPEAALDGLRSAYRNVAPSELPGDLD